MAQLTPPPLPQPSSPQRSSQVPWPQNQPPDLPLPPGFVLQDDLRPPVRRRKGQVWPVVIGVISIIYGGLYGYSIILAMVNLSRYRDTPPYVQAVLFAFLFWSTVLMAGSGMLAFKKPLGRWLLLLWAWVLMIAMLIDFLWQAWAYARWAEKIYPNYMLIVAIQDGLSIIYPLFLVIWMKIKRMPNSYGWR